MKAEELKEIRKKLGMSRKAFFETFGVPQKTLEDWEYGKRTPPDYVMTLLETAITEYIKNKTE